VPILTNLGADHVPRGVLREHYPVVMNAAFKVLKDNLGSEFTPAIQKAWKVVLNVV
jgi:hemoglobin-like flavoprotein